MVDRVAESTARAAETSRPARQAGTAALAGVRTVELAALVAIVVVAVGTRFVDLATRGMWDADQGHDMLVLRALVTDGVIPLLGPPTSIGAFHHGVLYYYLLAPAAALSGADPLGVVAAIALAGVAAVLVTWWLARSIGGPVAGVVAALLMAVSSAAIEESTFIWNPNLIALSSAIAFAAAWRAWTTGRARWWVVAAAAQVVTMHCHVLGSVLLVPLAALLVADWRRRRAGDLGRRRIAAAALAGVVLVALSYVPLAISEFQTGFAESRAAAAFLAGGGPSAAQPLPVRLVVVGLRVLAWPLTGLVTAAPVAAVLAAVAVVALLAWRATTGSPAERFVARWFAATLAWSIIALTVAASTLATVVPGLPNDHYHAFLDPIVFVTIGLAASAAWRSRQPVARVAAAAGVVAVIAFNVMIWPPRVAPDGGYPRAELAARRVVDRLGDRPYLLYGLPAIKRPDAYGFPLTRLEHPPALTDGMGLSELPMVIACDALFEDAIGAACGGPAEDGALATLAPGVRRTLIDRFDASSRTSISIYSSASDSP